MVHKKGGKLYLILAILISIISSVHATTKSDLVLSGEVLFSATEISSDGAISCSSCHVKNNFYIDSIERAIARKKIFPRNTPTLLNVNRYSEFLWDGRASSLSAQVSEPLFRPAELGTTEDLLSSYIKSNSFLRSSYEKSDAKNYSEFALMALSAYVKSIPSKTSKFESYLEGSDVFTTEEQLGWELFQGKARCIQCHKLPNLTDGKYRRNGLIPRKIILQSSGGKKSSRFTLGYDYGRGNIESGKGNMFSFRTPSLFNIAETSPYMHDGYHLTLEEVIDFYSRGGDSETESIQKLNLTDAEKQQLLLFLKTLSQND